MEAKYHFSDVLQLFSWSDKQKCITHLCKGYRQYYFPESFFTFLLLSSMCGSSKKLLGVSAACTDEAYWRHCEEPKNSPGLYRNRKVCSKGKYKTIFRNTRASNYYSVWWDKFLNLYLHHWYFNRAEGCEHWKSWSSFSKMWI